MNVTKAFLPIFFIVFLLLFFFFFTLTFPLVSDHFHLPLSLEHCLTAHLFSLCMFSLPPMFTFVSRLLFLFNSPWFSLGFSVLLIFSAALPFSPLTFHPRVPLGPCFQLGLFCLVYCTFPLPYVAQQPPFFFIILFLLFFVFCFPCWSEARKLLLLCCCWLYSFTYFRSPRNKVDGCLKMFTL